MANSVKRNDKQNSLFSKLAKNLDETQWKTTCSLSSLGIPTSGDEYGLVGHVMRPLEELLKRL